jgi:hypothetical protein
MLLTHIIIALSSVAWSLTTLLKPSKMRLNYAHLMNLLTISSGVYLVIKQNASILHLCVMGLIVIGANLFMMIIAYRNLAVEIDR